MNIDQINKAWRNIQIAVYTGFRKDNYPHDIAIVNELISYVNDFKNEEPLKIWFEEKK